VGSYAVRGTTKLFLLLFNKATSVKDAIVSITGGPTAAGNLYRFDPSNRIGAAGTAPFVAGAATLTLPARSATLVVLPFSGGSPAPRSRTWPRVRVDGGGGRSRYRVRASWPEPR
jgi:hypothetical protein